MGRGRNTGWTATRRGALVAAGTDEPEFVVWRTSAASNPNGDCVELARLREGGVAVRNSRDPHGPALIHTRSEIAAFLVGAKDGEFDDLVQ